MDTFNSLDVILVDDKPDARVSDAVRRALGSDPNAAVISWATRRVFVTRTLFERIEAHPLVQKAVPKCPAIVAADL